MIEKCTLADIDEISMIYQEAKQKMIAASIYQWTPAYPDRNIIESDITQGRLLKLSQNDEIITLASLESCAPHCYWLRRLVTKVQSCGQGGANTMLLEIENLIKHDGTNELYSSTNHTNYKMIRFFEENNFEKIDTYQEKERADFGTFFLYKKMMDVKL